VMPLTTPTIKVYAVKKLGSKVILSGDTYDEAYNFAIKYAKENNYNFVHPYDDLEVIAGQGTIAIELINQLEEHPDYVFIPVGGGGLLAGMSVYLKTINPKIKIIAVEAEDSACFNLAYKNGKPTSLKHVGIFADGVAVKKIGSKTFKLTKNIVDSSITVTTDEICSAIKELYDETRVIAEPAGALSLAGARKYILSNKIKNKNIATILCGANMNFDRLRHVSERADIGESSEIILGVTIDEKPGSFKKFCSIIGKRAITEFNYRYSDSKDAQVFVGIKTTKGIDEKREKIDKRIKKSSVIFICTPVSLIDKIIYELSDYTEKNQIISDVGSVKNIFEKKTLKLNDKQFSLVPGHPIAGTEYSGPEAGFASLFKNRWCIISADKKVAEDKIKSLENFWSKLGSKTKRMTFEDHDYVLSLTSHLPHAVAYSIVKTAINKEDKFKDDVIQYSAGGLRDFTRIAASDPLMWKDIFIDNSENILKVLDNYSKNLDEIKDAIKIKDSKKLLEIFSSTKKVRKEIIEAGQDTDKPGFGRK